MKIRSVRFNNHKKAFVLRTYKALYEYPYAMLDLEPGEGNRISKAYVDAELGDEAFTYELESGATDSVHIDRVLEYNRDPAYIRDLLLYELTVAAKKIVGASPLGIRELSRRLNTSPAQIYRILDQTNYRKSIDRVFELLSVLQCRIEIKAPDDQANRAGAPESDTPTLQLVVHA